MKMPSDKKGAPIVDEQQRYAEYFAQEEMQKTSDNPPSQEVFRAEEIPTAKKQPKVSHQKQDTSKGLALLSSSGISLAAVATTVAVSVLAIFPSITPTASDSNLYSSISEYVESSISEEIIVSEESYSSEEDSSSEIFSSESISSEELSSSEEVSSSETPPEPEPPPPPVFAMSEKAVGLHTFQGKVSMENTEGLTLRALVKDAQGRVVAQAPLSADGNVAFENLQQDSRYTLSIQDEEGTSLFTHAFTTSAYLTLTELPDGTGAKINIHESISLANDFMFRLYDAEGKLFSDNVYIQEIYDENWSDSSTDSIPVIGFEYYLSYAGLYRGEYTLELVTYDDVGEIIHDKKLSLGDLTPLVYTSSVDVETGVVTLQYRSGDVWEYANFYAELYQGGEYVEYLDVQITQEGMTMTLPTTLTNGTYTLYIIGEARTSYNQIYQCEIII